MKRIQNFGLIFLVAALFVSACDQGPAGGGGGSIAVMDLSAIAKATGQDEVIRQDAETARAELSAQLQQLATNLEQQLAAEREKVGISPSEADQQRLQEMTMQARQQISNAQMQAQSQASLMEQELVTAFRDKLTPLAEEIAKAKGASAVLAADSYLFWFDPTIDITDEVIAAWRALPDQTAAEDAGTAADVADELAAVQAELRAHIDAILEKTPVPDYIEIVNSIYHIENHLMVRHEDYDVLSTAAGIGVEGQPGTNKFASFGFSKPSRDSLDPKTQVAYIDWYQEVRQHDSMRGNFPDEVGRMWLQISAEQPFPFWCLTTYEFCARDMSIVKNAIGAAYYAMNAYRGDAADLYHPYYEGTGMVIAEYMKPY